MTAKLPLSALAATALLALASCGGGSAPPKPGTAAFYWSGARSAYKIGDYVRTGEELQRILVTENEYTTRARVWAMVVSAGLAHGYGDLADAYDKGAHNTHQRPGPFRQQVTQLRSEAGNMTLELADGVHKLLAQPADAEIVLAFTIPAGSAVEPAGMKRLADGVLVPEPEAMQIRGAMLRRGVLLAACTAAGHPDDAAKTAEVLQSGETRVSRDAFLLASAHMLEQAAGVFGTGKLDLPNRLKVALQEAQAALAAIPKSQDGDALNLKIQQTLKKARIGGV